MLPKSFNNIQVFRNGILAKLSSSTIASILAKLHSLLIIPIYIAEIGLAEFGKFGLISSAIMLATGLAPLGTGFLCKRYLPSANDRLEKAKFYLPQLIINLTVALIVVVLFSIVTSKLKIASDFPIGVIALYFITHVCYNQATNYLRYTNRIIQHSSIVSVTPFVSLLLYILYSKFTHTQSLESVFLSIIVPTAIVTVVLFIYISKEIWPLKFNFLSIRKDFYLGAPLLILFVSQFLLSSGDRFIMYNFLSAKAVGHYNTCSAIASIFLLIPTSFSVPLLPHLSRLNDTFQKDIARRTLLAIIQLFRIIAIPYIGLVALFGTFAFNIIVPNESVQNSNVIIAIIAAGIVFQGTSILLINAITVDLRTKSILKASLVSSLTNIVLNLVLLSYYPDTISTAISFLLSQICFCVFINRSLKESWDVSDNPHFIKTSLITIISILFIILLRSFQISFITQSIIVQLFIYSIIIFIFTFRFNLINIKESLSVMKEPNF